MNNSKFISLHDPSRENVGKIYNDLAKANTDSHVIVGDLNHEIMKGLVDDINEAIKLNPFDNRPFYIRIVDKKDLQMPRAIHRSLEKMLWRPWPEDNTTVFWVDPAKNDVRFCWCIPHRSEMCNMLENAWLYDPKEIAELIAWENFDLTCYGFWKDEIGNWVPNPNWIDKPLVEKLPQVSLFL